MIGNVLDPFDVVEIFGDELETGLSHVVFGEVNSSHSFYCQKGIDFLCALLSNSIVLEIDHFQATHIYYSTQKFSQSILGESFIPEVRKVDVLDHMKFIGGIEGSEWSFGVANARWEGKIVNCKGKSRRNIVIGLMLWQWLDWSLLLFYA